MKKNRLLLTLGLTLGLATVVLAAPCDNSNNCENPSFDAATQAGWVASASQLSGMKCLNSVGPTGNAVGSHYIFAASDTDLTATSAKGTITTSGTGSKVIGLATLASAPGTPTTVVNGGVVQQLLGGLHTYFIYVQACGSTDALDSGHCSVWARV